MRTLAVIMVLAGFAGGAATLWWLHGRPRPAGAASDDLAAPRTAPAAAAGAEAPRAAPPVPEAVADAVSAGTPIIAWTAHAGARLEPCGCVAGMHGGLARRATLLARVPAGRVLVLECGGWSGGRADYQVAKAEWFLRALAASGEDAAGIGAAEVSLGRDRLARLATVAAQARVPLVSANVRGVGDVEVVPAVHRAEVAGTDFAITSVSPAYATGDGLVVSDPAEALLRVRATTGDARLVVLADLDAAGLAELARAVPGLSLVVGGAVDQPSSAPVVVGGCRVIHVANEGKSLGWWPWGDEACSFELITDQIGDHPAVRALIGEYQDALGSLEFALDGGGHGLTALATGDTDARYVGSDACLACHAQAHALHAASRHAHALAALEAKNYAQDPECLRCHVTGLGAADGYHRRAPVAALALVSCEACHGRGSQHVADRAAGRAGTQTLTPVTPATCMRCHDHENSPRFDYAAYWEKIRHDRH
jgi:hypothetical protein